MHNVRVGLSVEILKGHLKGVAEKVWEGPCKDVLTIKNT